MVTSHKISRKRVGGLKLPDNKRPLLRGHLVKNNKSEFFVKIKEALLITNKIEFNVLSKFSLPKNQKIKKKSGAYHSAVFYLSDIWTLNVLPFILGALFLATLLLYRVLIPLCATAFPRLSSPKIIGTSPKYLKIF